MSASLIDAYGNRKYLIPRERASFVSVAQHQDRELAAFCLTLAITGARISEVLNLRSENIDRGEGCLVFRTLKQRAKTKYRLLPVPDFLTELLLTLEMDMDRGRLWSFQRTYAWRAVKNVMKLSGIQEVQCKPKALRHGFAVEAILNGVPLNMLQRWMGHARMETTAIYASVLGKEERQLVRKTWGLILPSLSKTFVAGINSASMSR